MCTSITQKNVKSRKDLQDRVFAQLLSIHRKIVRSPHLKDQAVTAQFNDTYVKCWTTPKSKLVYADEIFIGCFDKNGVLREVPTATASPETLKEASRALGELLRQFNCLS